MRRFSDRSRTKKRRGMISLELVLVLPVILIMFLGIVEFSFLLYARGDVIHASRNGARVASTGQVHPDIVKNEVQRTLGRRYGNDVEVLTRIGEFSGEEVIVSVQVPMTAAAPNFLWPIGYNLNGRKLIGETRMLKE